MKMGMGLKELDYRINELGKVVDVREVDNDGMMEDEGEGGTVLDEGDGEMSVDEEEGGSIFDEGASDANGNDGESDGTGTEGVSEGDVREYKLLRRLYGQMLGYMNTLPVLGFNSSRYDIPLVLTGLARHLQLEKQKYGFTVKKANSYACIQTDAFKFLDIKDFLAPGTSYDKFLKAYKVEETKGYFPYEWFDDASKLDYASLPPKDAFYSSLKEENISDENYEYCLNVWQR